jgi:uncharacterized surface protein with fasciclin (FAS1) repeats
MLPEVFVFHVLPHCDLTCFLIDHQDIKFDNGIIHIVDGALTLPRSAIITAQAAGLTKLVENLNAAGLAKTIEDSKDITIFAPSNAAFDATSTVISGPSTKNMSTALTYHVVKGVQYSNALRDGQSLSTTQGGRLKVEIRGGSVYINNARVVKTDILTKNGVIHVIDSILKP